MRKISDEQFEAMSTDDFIIIDALFYRRDLNDRLRERVKYLVDMGLVERIGRDKYTLSSSLYNIAGKVDAQIKTADIGRESNKELIYKQIVGNGVKGTSLSELLEILPGYSRSQIQVFLRELKRD